jgi:hypothetical protein
MVVDHLPHLLRDEFEKLHGSAAADEARPN